MIRRSFDEFAIFEFGPGADEGVLEQLLVSPLRVTVIDIYLSGYLNGT